MTDLLLHLAAAVAAFCQSVTGIGFGMIAGPVVLVILNDPAAVIISTLMSWLIALVLFPMLRHGTDWPMLGRLFVGAAIGLPAGLGLLAISDVEMLKLLAGLTIGLLTCLMIFGAPGMKTPGLRGDLVAGALAGCFGGCLAMPGPTAAIRMGGLGFGKATVRATMVTFFMAIWPMIFLGQTLTAGVSQQTLWNALFLVPATLAGVLVGNYAATRVSERIFARLVLGFLIATSLSLLVTSAWTLTGPERGGT